MSTLIETERLRIRHLTNEDAPFILELVNEPAFIQNIADRGVRTLDDARGYIGIWLDSYEKKGFGLWAVELKESGVPIGMCGLIKRDTLEDVDIGYAYLEKYWGKGYAHEAAAAVIEYGRTVIGLKRIVAITAPDNTGSIRVLEKIGLRFEKMIPYGDEGDQSRYFVPTWE